MNQDFQPYMELLAGNIDAHNLNAAEFVANAKTHKDAHIDHHYTEIISAPYLMPYREAFPVSMQPNFLNKIVGDEEGVGTDASIDAAYSLKERGTIEEVNMPDYVPENVRIIGKGGGWVPLGDGVKLNTSGTGSTAVIGHIETSSVGEVDLWINAFVQYFRNGFGFTMDEFVDPAMMPTSLDLSDNPVLDPEAIGSATHGNNEVRFVPPIGMEVRDPNRAAHHHVSMGYSPADIQFALRVDGQILEDTITGKRNTHSRTPLGARHIRTRLMDENAVHQDDIEKGYSTANTSAMNLKMPGTRQPDVRAAGIGPEVFGTRLNTVVRAGAGTHKVEIIARRLNAAESDLDLPNDVVAVFGRQLSVVEIPRDQSSEQSLSPLSMPTFSSEDSLDLAPATETLNTFCNDIPSIAIKPNSLRQEHLTSIVAEYARKTVSDPNRTITTALPFYDDHRAWHTYEKLHGKDFGGIDPLDSPALASGVGWRMIQNEVDEDYLMVSNGDSVNQIIDSSSLLMVFADVELKNIRQSGDVPLKARLLDAFAHICIGHREYNTKIGDPTSSKTWRFDRAARAHFNVNNWSGRNLGYNLSSVGTGDLEMDSWSIGSDESDEEAWLRHQQGAKDRRNIYDGAQKWNDNIHVSLMFVLDGATMRAPPRDDPTPSPDSSYTTYGGLDGNEWRVGDIGVFAASSACTWTGRSGTVWRDWFWSNSYYKEPVTGLRFGQTTPYTIGPPILEFGISSMSMIHLKRQKD
jgi:hypothetical protein